MARQTISQRIALEGGDRIKQQLRDLGETGEKAAAEMQGAFDKVKGPGAEFARNMDRAREKLRQVGAQMQAFGAQMRNVGLGLSAAVTAPLAALGAKSVSAWQTQADAVARLEAALKSTGAVAGRTSQDLQNTAARFQHLTTFGDEAILGMQAVLLTFTQIRGDRFDQATEAILNMSAALGKDLQASALQVGKALNDPVRGVSALAESGIQFSEQQRETIRRMVELGDVSGAQAIILGELRTQFGGMAEAMAQTDAGRLAQSVNALGDSFEQIGKQISPFIADMSAMLKTLAERFQSLPESAQRFIVIGGAISAAFGPLILGASLAVSTLGTLIGGFIGLMGWAAPLMGMFAGIGSALSGLLPAIAGVAAAFIGWPLVIGAALGTLFALIVVNWDRITAAVSAGASAAASAAGAAWDGITAAASAAWAGIASAAGAAWETVAGVTASAWEGIAAAIATAGQAVVAAADAAWNAAAAGADSTWAGVLSGVEDLAESVRDVFGSIGDFIADRFDDVRDVVSSVVDWASGRLRSILSSLREATGFGGGGGGGSSAPGFASGGQVRGPGGPTSDDILAWLSDTEFVIQAKAVRHYGAEFFAALNAMKLPRLPEMLASLAKGTPGKMPKFAAGGPVASALGDARSSLAQAVQRFRDGGQVFAPQLQAFRDGGLVLPALVERLTSVAVPMPIPAFATGGPVSASQQQQMTPVNLTIGGETFGGMMAPRDVADRLVRFAMGEQVRSAGRVPGWARS